MQDRYLSEEADKTVYFGMLYENRRREAGHRGPGAGAVYV